ncbi:hypothetical protein ABH926_010195 [Catenulispora sp. GP43]|uniref:hypothetical protein n=1 Tax=Catenulispora sp. GP43 TaxID=3156263 RepID=UPI0035151C44
MSIDDVPDGPAAHPGSAHPGSAHSGAADPRRGFGTSSLSSRLGGFGRVLAFVALSAALYAGAFGAGRLAGPVAPDLVPGAPGGQSPTPGMPGMGALGGGR